MSPSEQPNVILLMADQLPASMLGCYGHPIVRSPHIDALAAGGLVFENAYCASPLCGPSRVGVMTGVQPSRFGVYDNATEFAASAGPTIAHYLRLAGYETVASGKLHYIGPDQLHGLHRRLTTDIYPAGFEWTPADWQGGVKRNPGASVEAIRESGICRRSLQLDYDERVAYCAEQFLYDEARLATRRPFFLIVSFTHPHDPFYVTRKYWDRYKDEEIDPPLVPALPFETMHPYDQWLQYHHSADVIQLGSEEVRAARHAYYGMISYLDDKIGALVSVLEDLSLRDDTVVIFTSDHGEMLGERGMWYKRTFYDSSSRVPLIMNGTRIGPGRRRMPVSLLDIVPTICGLAGVDPWGAVEGTTLLTESGGGIETRAPVVGEYLGEGVSAPCRMVRSGPWKYVFVQGQREQLFNLDVDPQELHDKAATDGLEEVLAECRALAFQDWDSRGLCDAVVASQRMRRSLQGAYKERGPKWDYVPEVDEGQYAVRDYDAQETSKRRRI